MLSGLRVVSREEATSNLEHEDCKFDESRQRSRKHKEEEKRRRKKHARKLASRKHHRNSSDSSSSDSDEIKEEKTFKFRRQNRSKKGRYSDPSSSSNTDSEEQSPLLSGLKGVSNEMSTTESAAAARKAAGLDWMVQAPPSSIKIDEIKIASSEVQMEGLHMQVNPRELNPYLKDGGDGYPSEDSGLQKLERRKDLEAPVVGDGGVSWRLKALKRAKEQAEREGLKLDAVIEERWGSLAEMAVSVSTKRAAHAHAHLHAIRDRKRIESSKLEEKELGGEDRRDKDSKRLAMDRRDYLKDVSSRDMRMKVPNATDSLSWKRRQGMRAEDREIFHEAASALNKFQNDGSFLETFKQQHHSTGVQQEDKLSVPKRTADDKLRMERSCTPDMDLASNVPSLSTEGMSTNQLAAKALQLRLQGKTKEADALLNQLQNNKKNEAEKPKDSERNASYNQSLKSIVGDYNHRCGRNESGDALLVENIVRNKQYNRIISVDDEYESVAGNFKESTSKKGKQKGSKDERGKDAKQAIQAHKRIITQEERCQFCFNNPSRPKHLTISLGNTCYLMLPPREPLVDGHCLLVPMQHEGSSRNVDENVWEELRNYKKCLLQMFAKQDRDVLFMETVINLAKQRRHCLVECIPLPPDVAKQAPLYFKKAIDEAEDEWSQHDAKKLIETTGKGLHACIPKNFPYFHVEFGLHAGFVHVIDNERDFKSDFGRNVVIGMLKMPEEEMHRRRKAQSYEQQKKAVIEFQKAWDPFDWTKMLD